MTILMLSTYIVSPPYEAYTCWPNDKALQRVQLSFLEHVNKITLQMYQTKPIQTISTFFPKHYPKHVPAYENR